MSDQEHSMMSDNAKLMGWVGYVIDSWATSLLPFLRFDFGKEFFGFQAVAVLILIPVYSLFWYPENPVPLFYYLCVFLGLLILHRARTFWRMAKGRYEGHSRYSGTPWMVFPYRRLSEFQVKLFAEPLHVILAGYLIESFSRPLGWYFINGGICLFLSQAVNEWSFRRQSTAMSDAVIEQEYVAEQFRRQRHES